MKLKFFKYSFFVFIILQFVLRPQNTASADTAYIIGFVAGQLILSLIIGLFILLIKKTK